MIRHEDITGWPGYRASPTGVVETRWVYRQGQRRILGETWTPLKQFKIKGYFCVVLGRGGSGEGRQVIKRVHRLVLETFVGPCPPGMQCRHLDDDRSHNNLENLCWGTPLENAADRKRNGRDPIQKGSRNPNAKLKEEDIDEIRQFRSRGWTHARIGAHFHVARSTISMALNGKNWQVTA